VEYLLKWKGYDHKENTWEPKEHLNCTDLVDKFEKELASGKCSISFETDLDSQSEAKR
jgi:hypothetical protein